MTIDVRPAASHDADAIADAHVAAWRSAYRPLLPAAYLASDEFEARRRDRWRQRLHDGPPPGGDRLNQILVVVLDGRVVGFGHVGREYVEGGVTSERGEVYACYLHPDAWGSGAAATLIDDCHRVLRERFASAVLWVLEDNPRARRFYERSGWSCGTGDERLTRPWVAAPIDGIERPSTLSVIQYRIEL